MFSDPLLILGWLVYFHRCTAHCWPLSNRLLCVDRYGECARVCVCFRVLVFRLRGELARNREYDGDDDYYCCCCSSTTPTPAVPAAMLQLLVLRDATGMCAVAAATATADDDKGCNDAVVRASGGVWLAAANVGAAGQGIHVTTKNEKSTIVARSCFYF